MKRTYLTINSLLILVLVGIITLASCKKVEHGIDESIVSISGTTPGSALLGSTLKVDLVANNISNLTLSIVPTEGGESLYSETIDNAENKYILNHEIAVPVDEAWLGEHLIKVSYSAAGGNVEKTKAITFVEGDPVFFLVGGSTGAGWEPSAAIPMKMYQTGEDDVSKDKFEIFVYLVAADGGFKFLPTQGGWEGGLGDAGDGKLTAEEGDNNLTVDEDGFYRLRIDKEALTYEILKTEWGIIGDATAGGWDADTDMTFVGGKGSYTWTITTNLTAGEMKFRANDDWGINMGGTEGNLTQEGSNIAIADAGNYTINLHMDPSGYKAEIKKN